MKTNIRQTQAKAWNALHGWATLGEDANEILHAEKELTLRLPKC